jgi:hypothetical protein
MMEAEASDIFRYSSLPDLLMGMHQILCEVRASQQGIYGPVNRKYHLIASTVPQTHKGVLYPDNPVEQAKLPRRTQFKSPAYKTVTQ